MATLFFDRVSKGISGKQAEFEVASLDLGDQIAEWVPLIASATTQRRYHGGRHPCGLDVSVRHLGIVVPRRHCLLLAALDRNVLSARWPFVADVTYAPDRVANK
jgi:hypothetical protein